MPDEEPLLDYVIRKFGNPKLLLLNNVLLWIGLLILATIMEVNFSEVERTLNSEFNNPMTARHLVGDINITGVNVIPVENITIVELR